MIVAYVSGHGYGHATRVAEVLRAVRARDAGLPITVVTAAPEFLFRRAIPEGLSFRKLECDFGVVQRGALSLDEAATAKEWRAFKRDNDDRVDAEWRWLRHSGARVVVGDVPPLAFEAASEAGVPSVALCNFSWDWIYRHLSGRQPQLQEAASWAQSAYKRAGLLLKLPFAGDLLAFPKVVAVPLVARRPRLPKLEARKRLGLGSGVTALVSFGGVPLDALDLGNFRGIADIQFVTVGREARTFSNVRVMAADEPETLGLRYEDLVGAADVVITKPGYGIVSDAIGAGTRIVYTERGDFPEYPILVKEMPQYVPAAHVSNADLFAGRLRPALDAVLSSSFPPPKDVSGALVVAERLLAAVGS